MSPLANIFQPLIDVFNAVIVFIHDTIGASWGLSIILLTVAVRALLVPLAVKQYRSMRALARIAPELKKLQEKYKDDKQRLQQETMKFYQEHKVNPFASCLPLLAQLPVFLALFYALQNDLRRDICNTTTPCGDVANRVTGGTGGFGEEFFFIPDITDKATGGVLVALIVLYIGSQLLSSLLMLTPTTDRNQKIIFLALPFVFVLFIFNFPAGLIVYWITTNLWTILQQQTIKRVIPELPPLEIKEEPPRRGGGGSARPAAATAGAGGGGNGAGASKAPPPPPRRKRKQRSGRRR